MPGGQLQALLRHIRKIVEPEGIGGLSDTELLERFLKHRDEAAFEVLVWRHGAMVFSLCQRLLHHDQDAEDAFQATFLILVRKADSISVREALGSWLYKVAFRIALEAKARSRVRTTDPRHLVALPAVAGTSDLVWSDLRTVLDEEVARLPDKYRAPFVLCYLEGKTNEEAARQLGCPKGTVLSRLSRARERLRTRLTRRGLALSAGLLATVVSENARAASLPGALVNTSIKAALVVAAGKAATSVVSMKVATLAEGVIRAMFWTKSKTVVAILLVVSAIGFGGGTLTNWALGEYRNGVQESSQPPAALGAAEQVVPDQPLQAGGGQGRLEERAPQARLRQKSQNNLKQLALAMHMYHDTYGHFPAPAFYNKKVVLLGGGAEMTGGAGDRAGPAAPGGGGGVAGAGAPIGGGGGAGGSGVGGQTGGSSIPAKGGKALLSWRVALLPYLEQDELYRQFRLNEPWDSVHNKKLLARMPNLFAAPGVATKQPYLTYYQVFVGEGAGFEKHRAMRIADIPDGVSNTIMIVEAAAPVPWTKPEDLVYDPDQPLPELGGPFPSIFHAALFDGSVHTFEKTANQEELRAAITRNGGEAINFQHLSASDLSAKPPRLVQDVREQNERLHAELSKARDTLAAARKTVDDAKKAEFDSETSKMIRENAELEQELRRIRKEIEDLKAEWERLRPGKSPQRKD